MSEKELIHKIKRNKRRAQRMLYERYRSFWFTICLRYTTNDHDASDILQNALVNIYGKINQFDELKGSFKSWSAKIVVNESLMFLRNNSRKIESAELQEAQFIESKSHDAIDSLSAKELVKLIRALPDGYRTVFNLYVMEGYNHTEIADILNITVGTSKSQLFKARKLLQEKLAVLI